MQENKAMGKCLCGEVSYEIIGNLGIFQYCHCSRCRKFTGSAYAANILVAPDQFHWLSGESNVGRYEPAETRHFATSFCRTCGSSLPWLAKSGASVIVPAGTLENHPGIEPSKNIFYGSRAPWYKDAGGLPKDQDAPTR